MSNTIIFTNITSSLLLPKIAHTFHVPGDVWTMQKKKKKICWWQTVPAALSYLCRTLALSSTWNQFSQPLSLDVQITFHKENAVTVSWTLLQHFQLPKSCCLSGGKQNYSQLPRKYWQQSITGLRTLLTVIWLVTLTETVRIFNHFNLYLQLLDFDRKIFAVSFLYHTISLV